jgi:hypothetical protein
MPQHWKSTNNPQSLRQTGLEMKPTRLLILAAMLIAAGALGQGVTSQTVTIPPAQAYAAFIVPDPGATLTLTINAASSNELVESAVVPSDTGDMDLWSPWNISRAGPHVYTSGTVLSSREWLRIHGKYKPTGGTGGGGGTLPEFDVDVPGVDVDIEGVDEDKEETEGGYVCVGTNCLTKVTISPVQSTKRFSGKVKLTATQVGAKIRLWQDKARTQEITTFPKEYSTPSGLPTNLLVEGITPSTSVRDVELKVSYKTPTGNRMTEDKVKFTIIRVDTIKFQKSTMVPNWKTVDQVYKHLGVFTDQSAKFGVNTTPSRITLPNGLLTWGGLTSGATPEVSAIFTASNFLQAVTITCAGTTKSALVAIRDQPSGLGEEAYALLHLAYTMIAIANNLAPITYPPDLTTLEPYIWASSTYPGNQRNTIADAARHAYWTCLLTRYTVAGYAEGLTTQHEVSRPGPSTETVMDLHNNLMGISIEDGHTHTPGLGCCRSAVQNAVLTGALWYLDSSYGVANTKEDALLQPTNK